MNNKYDDIINLERPKSLHRPMSLYNRAAQFSPFVALVGYGDLILEAGRYVDEKIELDQEKKDEINRVLFYLDEHLKDDLLIKIVYFCKDSKKDGGFYLEKSGFIKKIDTINKTLLFKDKNVVNIDDLYSITILADNINMIE